jgi:hypothetical protein
VRLTALFEMSKMNVNDRDSNSKQNSNGGEKRSHFSSEVQNEDDIDQASKRQNTGGSKIIEIMCVTKKGDGAFNLQYIS